MNVGKTQSNFFTGRIWDGETQGFSNFLLLLCLT